MNLFKKNENWHLNQITVSRLRPTDGWVLRWFWNPLFIKNFPDENDREPLDQLLGRLANEPNTFFFLARDRYGKPVGQELGQLTDTGGVYIPYSATRDGDRNKGVNPATAQVTDEIYKKAGATHFLIDVEDHRVIENGVYADDIAAKQKELLANNEWRSKQTLGTGEPLEAKAQKEAEQDVLTCIIEGRQNYWRRQGYRMVVPKSELNLQYVRPSSEDPNKIQGYDTLIFRILDENDPKWKDLYKDETKSQISMEHYKNFYLEMTRAQYGKDEENGRDLTDNELKERFPAVKDFLDRWQVQYDKGLKWVDLRTDPVRPSSHPIIDINVTATETKPRNWFGPAWEYYSQKTAPGRWTNRNILMKNYGRAGAKLREVNRTVEAQKIASMTNRLLEENPRDVLPFKNAADQMNAFLSKHGVDENNEHVKQIHHNLGLLYAYGLGVDRDAELARTHLTKTGRDEKELLAVAAQQNRPEYTNAHHPKRLLEFRRA